MMVTISSYRTNATMMPWISRYLIPVYNCLTGGSEMSATKETMDKPYIPASALAMADDAKTLLDEAKSFVVVNDGQYEIAGGDLKRIKNKMRDLEEMRKNLTRPIDAAKKAVMDFFRQPEEYLRNAESAYKRAMLVYQDEQERQRKAEENRIRELQRQEQERLAKEAEAAERESRRLAEEAAKKERGAAAIKDSEARRIAEEEAARLRAESEQNQLTANAVIDQAASLPPAIVTRELPQTRGVTTRTTWAAELVDKMTLVKAVAAGTVPLIALDVNQKFLNQQIGR